MPKPPEIGCEHPTFEAPERKLKPVAFQLIATVTLALSTLAVATAVSFGLARAEFDRSMTRAGAAPCAITLPPMDRAA